MNWKTEQQLRDLSTDTIIEATCRRCGKTQTRMAIQLQTTPERGQLYLDELEQRLVCSDRQCRGRLRIALEYQHKVEGFTGGIA